MEVHENEKKLLATLGICALLLSNISVYASETESGEVTRKLFSPDGEVIIEYSDDKSDETPLETRVIIPSLNPFSRSAITYTSTLKPLNNYTQLQAMSKASTAIDKMRIYCSASYASGTNVGNQRIETPSGWKVMIDSITIKVPASALNLKIASGISQHAYDNAGYITKTHNLSWKK